MSVLICLGQSVNTVFGVLGLNTLNHSWQFQMSYIFPLQALVPMVQSKFLAEHATDEFRLVILNCVSLDKGIMASQLLSAC